jgi:hypothetical protein
MAAAPANTQQSHRQKCEQQQQTHIVALQGQLQGQERMFESGWGVHDAGSEVLLASCPLVLALLGGGRPRY